jgi:hypothetical protein
MKILFLALIISFFDNGVFADSKCFSVKSSEQQRYSPTSSVDFPQLKQGVSLLKQDIGKFPIIANAESTTSLCGKDVEIYYGQTKGGFRHGKGRLVTSHYTYEGDFQMDLKHGYGVFKDTEGYIYEGLWDQDVEVLSDEFFFNPKESDLAIYTHFFRLLLSDEGGHMRWCQFITKKILVEILRQRGNLKEVAFIENSLCISDFIDKYSCVDIPHESLVDLTCSNHCFLLFIQKNFDATRTAISLLDSNSLTYSCDEGYEVETGKFFELKDSSNLIEILKDLERCDNCREVTDCLEQSIYLDKLQVCTIVQRDQKTDTCSLDCWLTFLRFVSSEFEWLCLRKDLFSMAYNFHTFMGRNKKGLSKCMKNKHARLAQIAKEKMKRREVKLRMFVEQ